MLTITVGNAFADHHEPATITVTDHPIEFAPDVVFRALNRRDAAEVDNADNARIYPAHAAFMADLRARLDRAGAPSMSVGDTITIATPSGDPLGTWTCARFGWDHAPATAPAEAPADSEAPR